MIPEFVRFFRPPPGANDVSTVRARLMSRVLNVHIATTVAIGLFYPNASEARGVVATA